MVKDKYIPDRGYEVKITNEKIRGVVLSDQIKSLDWTKRDIEYITKATEEEIAKIAVKINILVNE
jgi:mRNA interferase MazF